jgi:hypothetical protein
MAEVVADPNKTRVQGVLERLHHLRKTRDQMKASHAKAVEAQCRYYNQKRTPMAFELGQVVGLSTRNFRFKAGQRKLAPTFIKVIITGRVGKAAYRVQLPAKYSRLHNVFPVSLLEPWDDSRPRVRASELPELEEETEEWEVEDITGMKETEGERWFQVKWAGWPAEYNTWEPEKHLENARKLLNAYCKKKKKEHRKWDDPKPSQHPQ